METVDEIIDRRRLRRRLSFWRAAAFVVLAIALVSIVLVLGSDRIFSGKGSDHIARVTIDGVIVNDKVTIDFLKQIEKDENVKGVILAVSSPGGSTGF